MSAEDLTTQCDCYAYSDQMAQHAMTCSLWDNDLFVKGHADWDPNLEMLVLVHPLFQSLHEMSDEQVAAETGGAAVEVEIDPVEEAIADFEDRCLAREEELWASGAEFPPYNYTLAGVSRVFNEETCEWENAKLGCHCEPAQDTFCLICGVWREKPRGKGTWHEQQWKASIVRQDDVVCRCAGKLHSSWNCSVCEVKRMPSKTGIQPEAVPMMRWTDEMKKKTKGQVAKGGVTAWSGFGTKGGVVTTYVSCRHKGRELLFPNGQKIYGSSCHAQAEEGYVPDFGFYLDSCWFSEAHQLGIMVPWQDMGLPKIDRDHVDAAVTLACTMIERGDIIEVGCIGGHGRTGTFLALIAMRNGVKTPEEAIAYVREHYCEKAIESSTQEWYVKAWYALDNDLPVPEKPAVQSFKGGGSIQSHYQKNKNVLTAKKVDTKIWYCPECNADLDDDATECYWCLAKFKNEGLRPIEEWWTCNTPKEVERLEARIANPQKVPEDKLRKPAPPKVVTVGTGKATQQGLPFGTPQGDIEDLESQILGGWTGP